MQRSYSAGILILNWNGAQLLQEHLPSVIAAAEHSDVPIVVADNGSTDNSISFLETYYPSIQVIRLEKNHGFGRGYNLAMEQVTWDLVVLLNNDMAVERDFLDPLLAPFEREESLFATTAQIFLQDPDVFRCETGRTCARFRHGEVQIGRLDVGPETGMEPVFWFGGGSSVVSRRKYFELGGFDEIFSPFYFEDTDLSYRAWKQGWSILFVPDSRVTHKYRGSTGRLDHGYVDSVFARNRLLFTWLNLHDRRMLAEHLLWFPYHCARLIVAALRGDVPARSNLKGIRRALWCLPTVWRRRRLRSSAVVGDREIFSRFGRIWTAGRS